jgi:hypothetical protein
MAFGLIAGSAASGASSRSAEVRVTSLRVKLLENQVLLSFKLADVFDEDLERRIESGLLTGFAFQFQLVQDRKSWFDRGVDSGTLRVDAMYNAVTREYLINYRYDGDLIESRVVRASEDLRNAMTTFSEFPVFTVEGRARRQRVRVRVRAVLGTRMVLFFIPRTRSTDWVETRKFLLEESPE